MPKPVSDDLLKTALTWLNLRGPDGVTRRELADMLEVGDRTARAVIATFREDGVAPVVSAVAEGRGRVYRIAQDREEYRKYRRGLISRIRHLAKAVRGLDRAWQFEDPELSPLLERVIDLTEVRE